MHKFNINCICVKNMPVGCVEQISPVPDNMVKWPAKKTNNYQETLV